MTRALTFTVALVGLLFSADAALAQGAVEVATDQLRTSRQASATCGLISQTSAWTGHWTTTVWGRMSVCNCEVGTVSRTSFDIEAGPIWNQSHARQVCPRVCTSARWSGAWSPETRRALGTCILTYAGHLHGAVRIQAPTPVVRRAPARPASRHLRAAIAVRR